MKKRNKHACTLGWRRLTGAAIAIALTAASYGGGPISPFPSNQGFENDTDSSDFVPTNPVPPFVAPNYPGQLPGAPTWVDFFDSRNGGDEGLIEEIPGGSPLFHSVPANSGSSLGVVYPGTPGSYGCCSVRNGPFGRLGREMAFPAGSGDMYAWQTDIYALPGAGGTGLWWTNAASHASNGGPLGFEFYGTESGFHIVPGAANWTFTTTAGGNPSISLPVNNWYHLEVVFDRSNPAGTQIWHRIYNADRTVQLYDHLIPPSQVFLNLPSGDLGGPRYTWFTVWDDNGVDRVYIDNLGNRSLDTEVSMVANDSCFNATESSANQLVVELRMTGALQTVVGGQFFMEFDNTALAFVDAEPGDAPFVTEIYQVVNGDEIDYAVGVSNAGGVGTSADTVLARLRFTVLNNSVQACSVSDLVSFRAHTPPTQLTDPDGFPVAATFNDLGPVTIDQVAPVITCPANVMVNADAGGCDAAINTVVSNWSIGGGAEYVSEPNGNVAVELTSANPGPPPFSFAFHNLPSPQFTFQNLTDLSADYNMQSGCFNGGAPRFSVRVDFDNNGIISAGDRNVHIYWGTVPNFTDCPPLNTWLNTGDLADATDLRYDTSNVGGTFYDTRANANALVGSMLVLRINIPMDGQFAPGTQQMWLDNVNINGVVHTFNGATATDNCDTNVSITAVRSDAPATLTDPFPAGITTITYTATDDCGNTSTCQQTVTVSNQSQMSVDVHLEDSPSSYAGTSFTRCITFELFEVGCGGSVVVSQDIAFTDGQADNVSVLVPCGDYDCITARDRKHTLRKTSTITDAGVNYDASFTGGDALTGGNLNDDPFIDILDFGIFVGQFGNSPGANTLCGHVGNHADISGNGLVGSEDYTFIQQNFLETHEANCCVVSPLASSGGAPITAITVKQLQQLGMHDLVIADLNGDGWLDQNDIAAFLNGATVPPHGGVGGGAIGSGSTSVPPRRN